MSATITTDIIRNRILKYKFLAFVYLISVLSSSIANSIDIDVQAVYRVPAFGIRWIDLAIIFVISDFCIEMNNKYATRLNGSSVLVALCFVFLSFELFQLIRSWQMADTSWQIAGFLCTLSIFTVIDLATFRVPPEVIFSFLRRYAFWGAIVMAISNAYLFYAFLNGKVLVENSDSDINRVSIDIINSKETVYTYVLTPFVYAFSLHFLTVKSKVSEKIIYSGAIVSILAAQVYLFERGTLFMLTCITCYFIFALNKKKKGLIVAIAGLSMVIAIAYFSFADVLREKGYDPVEKLVGAAEFAADVNNPEWDKGRHIPREYALSAWEDHRWIGVGYDELHNYGLPAGINTAHNFVITSLFHRGVIGTFLYLLILFILFNNGFQLWKILRREKTEENELIKLLIIVAFCWLVTFWTQEAHWEKYSLSVEFLYLGLITNYFRQLV
jgi:hypothetical protein